MSPLKHRIHPEVAAPKRAFSFYKPINNKNYTLRFNYATDWMHYIHVEGTVGVKVCVYVF